MSMQSRSSAGISADRRIDIRVASPPAAVGGARAVEGAMPRANLWNNSAPRVELDQRARDARLRLEQIERRLAPRAAVTASWLRRVLGFFSFGEGPQGRRTRGPLSNRRPSRISKIDQVRRAVRDSFGRAFVYHPSPG